MKLFARQTCALVRLSFIELWRRNDIFALLLLGLALMVPLSMATPLGAEGASRYLDEMALLLVWGFSLFIALGAGQRLFPPEFDSRTIYPLLAKPISRGRLLVGKELLLCRGRTFYDRGRGDVTAARAAFLVALESADRVLKRDGDDAEERIKWVRKFAQTYLDEIAKKGTHP